MADFEQYLFDSRPHSDVATVSRPLREQLGLQTPDDWNTETFWSRIQPRLVQSVMLLVCSKFLRKRSCDGHTPAMYLSYLSCSDFARHLVLSLFRSAPEPTSNSQCKEDSCSNLFCTCLKQCIIATEYHSYTFNCRSLKEIVDGLKIAPKTLTPPWKFCL